VATTEELIDVLRQGGVLESGRTVGGNQMIDFAAPLLEAYATPDFVTVMTSESATREHPGLEGYREALTDWISPYEAFRFEIEEVIVKDDRLVFLARQVATTKHQGVEVVTESASVWWLRDGRIAQIDFYLDKQAALKAAGVDPDRPSRD
jgi:ketosteroid isomerase-like protein